MEDELLIRLSLIRDTVELAIADALAGRDYRAKLKLEQLIDLAIPGVIVERDYLARLKLELLQRV